MFWKCALLIVLLFTGANIGQLSAQEDAIQESKEIPLCTEEELEDIQRNIDVGLSAIRVTITSWDEANIIEAVEDSARSQRSFVNVLPLLPECAETYTKAYPLAVVLDELAIARGMMLLAAVEIAQENADEAEEILDDVNKHLREAGRILQRKFPEFYGEHFPQDWE